MRLGLIGYSSHSGLGVMNEDLLKQFDFNAHLIIPIGDKEEAVFKKNAALTKRASNWQPTEAEVNWLLDNSDTIVTIETDFNSKLFERAKARGKRTVFLVMSEWFDHTQYKDASVFLCTAQVGYEFVKFPNKVLLPWPLDTEKFKFKERGNCSKHFLHNAGYGGLKFRKGTIETVKAFVLTKETCPDIVLTINSQRPLSFFGHEVEFLVQTDPRITFNHKNVEDGATLYEHGDCYIYPARYDGQPLTAEEAMACGFPTFVTDAEPMNELSDDVRFKLSLASNEPFKVQDHMVALNIVDVNELAKKIEWASQTDLREVSRANRAIIESNYSWSKLKGEYEAIFKGN